MKIGMNRLVLALVPVLVAATACDPYPAASDAKATVQGVDVRVAGASPVSAVFDAATSTWVVENYSGGTASATLGQYTGPSIITYFTNTLDGTSIQALPSIDDLGTQRPNQVACVPKTATSLIATPAAGASEVWLSCYSPGSPIGPEVIVYKGSTTNSTSVSGRLPAGADVSITGNWSDHGGNAVSVKILVRTLPFIPAGPTYTNAAAGAVTVGWAAGAGAVSWDLQRAPADSSGCGTFANVTTGNTTRTFDDTPGAGGFCYRAVAHGANGKTRNGTSTQVTVP